MKMKILRRRTAATKTGQFATKVELWIMPSEHMERALKILACNLHDGDPEIQ
jgi:hypothetical protein